MAFNFNTTLFSWLHTGLFWTIIIFGILVGGILGLYYRKKRRCVYPCLIFTKIGNYKAGITTSRAGEFKSNFAFFGLIDYGREKCIKLVDGRKVLGASLNDMHEINGKMGFLLYRKEDDPKIIVPIERVKLANEELINAIASADFRDASSDIVAGAVKETQTGWEKYGTMIITASVLIISLIIIIFIVQFANHQVDKAGDILKSVAQTVASSSGKPSTTAP